MNRILRFLFPVRAYGDSASWLLLAARLVFGLLLLSHGLAKWQQFDALADSFPDPIGLGRRTALVLAIFAELFCSVGVIVGAFYRLALIPMIFTMAVAVFIVHGGDPFAAKELAVAYLSVYVLLFMAGPGDFALDRIFGPRFPKRLSDPGRRHS